MRTTSGAKVLPELLQIFTLGVIIINDFKDKVGRLILWFLSGQFPSITRDQFLVKRSRIPKLGVMYILPKNHAKSPN